MPISTQQKGFTLIEILVALLILAVGLLGTASLLLLSMKSNQSASQRTQASLLAYDLAERMRMNRDEALAGNYTITSASAVPASPNCITTGCSNVQQRDQDIREWSENFADINAIGADGGDYRPAIAGSTFDVRIVCTNLVVITVMWIEPGSNHAAVGNAPCGEALHQPSNDAKSFILTVDI